MKTGAIEGGSILMVTDRSPVGFTPFVACTSKVKTPGAVGVPVRSPVLADKLNHDGAKAGLTTE